jgi:hypothetical protein
VHRGCRCKQKGQNSLASCSLYSREDRQVVNEVNKLRKVVSVMEEDKAEEDGGSRL